MLFRVNRFMVDYLQLVITYIHIIKWKNDLNRANRNDKENKYLFCIIMTHISFRNYWLQIIEQKYFWRATYFT